jgi:hypothetical protein
MGEGDPHDIEAEVCRGWLSTLYIQARCAHDARALACIHCFKWMATFFAGARTDFNENKNALIVCHQVQLPFGAAPVSLDNAVTRRF